MYDQPTPITIEINGRERFLGSLEDNAITAAEERLGPDLFDACVKWIYKGRPSGGWFTAVLENDLRQAVNRADAVNLKRLPDLVRWLYSYAPSLCYGTPERVSNWANLDWP